MALQNDAPGKLYWAAVFVDGVKAQHKILQGPASGHLFVGFARRMGHGGGERAFCFSMPRPVFEVNGHSSVPQEQDPEKLVEIGSVRVDIHETTVRDTWTEMTNPSSGIAKGKDIDFTPTDKKTAKRFCFGKLSRLEKCSARRRRVEGGKGLGHRCSLMCKLPRLVF